MAEIESTTQVAFQKSAQLAMLQGLALKAHELGESWMSFNAQFSADWLALQYALMNAPETLEVEEESLPEFLNTLWLAVETTVVEFDVSVEGTVDVGSFLQTIREQYSRSLNPHAWAYFTELVAPASTYAGSELSQDSIVKHFSEDLFGEQTDDVLVAQKQHSASKLYKEYYMLRQVSPRYAVVALYKADLLLFHSWLLANGKRIGDHTRVWATMIAVVANNYISQVDGIPTDINAYHRDIRASFLRAVGQENSESLVEVFPQILV